MDRVPCRVALVGLMGAGKSRVGRRLAVLLGWPFWDADRLAETQAGKSIAELFDQEGEDAFRRLETSVLRDLGAKPPPLVAALGGGVVEHGENRELLRAAFFVVWLEVSADQAALRVGRGTNRPLLGTGSPRETLEHLKARREPLYREVSQRSLQADAASPATLARHIAALLPRIDPDDSRC